MRPASPGAAPPPLPGTTTRARLPISPVPANSLPGEASYFYERGLAHGQNKQPDLALADFDAAIKLKPDDVAALVARASVRAARHDPEAAIVADLEQADRAAPKEDAVRMRMGYLYEYIGQPAAAIVQYSKWIEVRDRATTCI